MLKRQSLPNNDLRCGTRPQINIAALDGSWATAALSAMRSFVGWFWQFLGEWPVLGNCPNAFALAANGRSPLNSTDPALGSSDRFGL
jgi:hypothetical protein